MADVDDRGQLLLVGALTFAVMLVALAVLLNAAIYTGNVATRDAGPGTGEVIEYENEASSMAQTTIDALSERENQSYRDLRRNFTRSVDIWSETARTHSAVSVASAEVETISVQSGTLVRQDDHREFTGNGGEQGWTVADDTTAREIRLNVSQDSLYSSNDTDDAVGNAFRVRLFDDFGGHQIQIYSKNGSDNVTVGVGEGGDRIGECSVGPGANGHAIVELAEGRVGGEPCPELTELFDGVQERYDVHIEHGNRASGTYSILVDRDVGAMSVTTDRDADGPYATAVLYSADLELTYRTADIYYQTEFTVAPGEADD